MNDFQIKMSTLLSPYHLLSKVLKINMIPCNSGHFRYEESMFVNNEITGKYTSPHGAPGGKTSI